MDDPVFPELPPGVMDVPLDEAAEDARRVLLVGGMGNVAAAFFVSHDGEVDEQLLLIVEVDVYRLGSPLPIRLKLGFPPGLLDQFAQVVLTSVNPMADSIQNADPEKLAEFINERRRAADE